jgi:hypothetical protein
MDTVCSLTSLTIDKVKDIHFRGAWAGVESSNELWGAYKYGCFIAREGVGL